MKLVFSSLLSIPITTALSLCCDCLSFQPHGKQQRTATVIRYLGFEIRPNGQIFSFRINQRRRIRVRNQRNGQSIWQKFTKSHCSCGIARVKSKTEMTMPGLAGGETFGQEGDDFELPSEGSVSVTGGVVALGKFDALHIGHRELAIQASKSGTPFLVSFVGIAEVLGWEPRAPIVAKCDRKRVLSSWAPYCGNVAPAEFHVQFSSVRHLTPQQFVEKLAKELGVRGVVAGENYRFGYKAAGDASELVRLCEEYGMGAFIVSSVMDNNQLPGVSISMDSKDKGQVSSTRVRHALALGDMEYVSKLLGRDHRLMLLSEQGFVSNRNRISAPKSCLLNLPPKEGLYENCSLLVDNNIMVSCTTMIDSTHIHVESIDTSILKQIPFQDYRQISIEFGSSAGC